MSEYLRVEGHQHLVRDTRTNAIVNKNKNAYIPLLVDVNIGLFAFLSYHLKLINF